VQGYFYKGKHRKPTNKARTLATVTGAGAIALGSSVISTPVANAAAGPPGGWGPIIQCESGNRNIENPSPASSASGYFQFTDGTWRAHGGTEFAPRAIGASFSEQLIVAERAFKLSGLSPWTASRHCWQGRSGGAVGPRGPQPVAHVRHRDGSPARVVINKGKTHIVKVGDTLSRIAGSNWKAVYEANKETIGSNPNLIFPGQELKV
jgi:hypothetical protein